MILIKSFLTGVLCDCLAAFTIIYILTAYILIIHFLQFFNYTIYTFNI